MAEAEKKSFFKSKAFMLIMVWMALGGVLTVVILKAKPAMEHACEGWAQEIEMPAGEHHGEEAEHDACHLVAEHGEGFTRNLAASFHAIAGMPLATAWNIPNFLILVTLLWHFAKDPVNNTLKSRKEDLERAIKEAEKARLEAEAAKKEYRERLENIDEEIKALKHDMQQQGWKEREKIIAEAENQTKRIANDAEFTAKQELLTAQYKLREEAARLAVEIAENVIRKSINDQDRERLLTDYLEKVMEQGK